MFLTSIKFLGWEEVDWYFSHHFCLFVFVTIAFFSRVVVFFIIFLSCFCSCCVNALDVVWIVWIECVATGYFFLPLVAFMLSGSCRWWWLCVVVKSFEDDAEVARVVLSSLAAFKRRRFDSFDKKNEWCSLLILPPFPFPFATMLCFAESVCTKARWDEAMRDIFGVRVLLQLYARAPFRSILFFGGVWCLKSLTQRKRKRMMMNTRGLTGGKTKFFSVFHFFTFFVEKCKKKRISFWTKRKYLFQFPRQREEEKVGKIDRIAKEKEALHCSAYNNKRVCVCVYSSHLILINEKRRRENWVIYNTIDNNI